MSGVMEDKVGAGEPEGTATTPAVGQHTPGPWKAVYDHDMGRVDRIRGADKVDVAVPTWGPRSAGEINANARLIAAAPDLLEAAEEVVSEWEQYLTDDRLPAAEGTVDALYENLRRAIAKARGHR